jgi:hypothetical protein
MPFYVWSCEDHVGAEKQVEQTFEAKPEPKAPSCAHCGTPMERDYHLESRRHIPASGYPYVTKNITGKEITVTDAGHEAELCKIHGVAKRDDAAWIEKRYVGYNWKTGEQEYTEGSGRGLPGSWV